MVPDTLDLDADGKRLTAQERDVARREIAKLRAQVPAMAKARPPAPPAPAVAGCDK